MTPDMRPDVMRTYPGAIYGCLTGFCADFGRYHDTNHNVSKVMALCCTDGQMLHRMCVWSYMVQNITPRYNNICIKRQPSKPLS